MYPIKFENLYYEKIGEEEILKVLEKIYHMEI
jgi:hypothetical protein